MLEKARLVERDCCLFVGRPPSAAALSFSKSKRWLFDATSIVFIFVVAIVAIVVESLRWWWWWWWWWRPRCTPSNDRSW